MWTAFLRIFEFLQILMPWPVLYDAKKGRFVENSNISKRFYYMNWVAVQIWIVTTLRMLNYLQTKPGQSGITFVDFVLDLLLWALALLHCSCGWSFYRKRHCIMFTLNQFIVQRKYKGKYFKYII